MRFILALMYYIVLLIYMSICGLFSELALLKIQLSPLV